MGKAIPLIFGETTDKPFEAAPALEQHPLSIEFMNWDLARSGLVPEDIQAYPSTPLAMKTIGTYVFSYPDKRMWAMRIDRRLVENGEKLARYKAPSGISDIWWPHDVDFASYLSGLQTRVPRRYVTRSLSRIVRRMQSGGSSGYVSRRVRRV